MCRRDGRRGPQADERSRTEWAAAPTSARTHSRAPASRCDGQHATTARRQQVEELTLKSAGATSLRALLNDVWLLQTRHVQLAGDVPFDRAGNTLAAFAGALGVTRRWWWRRLRPLYPWEVAPWGRTEAPNAWAAAPAICAGHERGRGNKPASHGRVGTGIFNPPIAGGKQVVLFGGVSSSHEEAGSETAILSLETLQWERPASGQVRVPPAWGQQGQARQS